MQKEDCYGGINNNNNEGTTATVTNSSTFRPRNTHHLSQHQFNETDFNSNSLHQSMLELNRRSMSVTSSECYSHYETAHALSAANRLKEAQFVLEYQQLYNRYSLLITRLQESLREAGSIRQENDDLRIVNTDLMKRLNLLSQATIQNSLLSNRRSSPLSIINNFNHLSLGANVSDDLVSAEIVHPNTTTSVRSRDYLNISQRGGSKGKNPAASGSGVQQRVYPGGEQDDDAHTSSRYTTRV
ncbi:zinc finger CCCH domain-containing protein 9-like [Impatiens glandulifera]|uniref:zinc finger CCCH domain-containing protein 9-like n=1 Tax=Impatiens glandulifera TaxID=253017 RepID=UPI001FB0C6B5|nr:zinc finger CCCH domain-containing protein 9-like [Impatiens glandulifera]